MEFIRELSLPAPAFPDLKDLLTIDRLPELCASISTATPTGEGQGDLYCLWGAFTLRRDVLRNGVRFALLECPHALAWTVTLDAARALLIVHCSIDKSQPDPEFAESIEGFVADWADGLRRALAA